MVDWAAHRRVGRCGTGKEKLVEKDESGIEVPLSSRMYNVFYFSRP